MLSKNSTLFPISNMSSTYNIRNAIELWYVSNVSIIFYGFMLLSCQTLDVLYAFYIFNGTNLLTQCQVLVPVFSMFLTPFRGGFWTESKRNKIAKKIFSETKEDRETWEPRQGVLRDPTSPHGAVRGEPVPPWLVGSLGHLCPRFCAYIFPKIPEKIRRSLLLWQ